MTSKKQTTQKCIKIYFYQDLTHTDICENASQHLVMKQYMRKCVLRQCSYNCLHYDLMHWLSAQWLGRTYSNIKWLEWYAHKYAGHVWAMAANTHSSDWWNGQQDHMCECLSKMWKGWIKIPLTASQLTKQTKIMPYKILTDTVWC